jgi:methionine-rich copper-binding protein CopC
MKWISLIVLVELFGCVSAADHAKVEQSNQVLGQIKAQMAEYIEFVQKIQAQFSAQMKMYNTLKSQVTAGNISTKTTQQQKAKGDITNNTFSVSGSLVMDCVGCGGILVVGYVILKRVKKSKKLINR